MVRALAVGAVVIVLFGILVPLRRGVAFLNPLLLTAYVLLGVVIAAPTAAGAFAGRDRVHGRVALRKLAVVAGYSWGLSVVVVAAGLLTVNFEGRWARPVLPKPAFTAAWILCSAAATVFAALVAALLARSYSDAAVRNTVRLVFLGVVIFIIALSRFGGPDWVSAVFRWSTSQHMRTLCVSAAVLLSAADLALAVALARTLSRAAPSN